MSVFVWKAVQKKSWLWYLLAVAYHALLDGTSVILVSLTSNYWVIEAVLGIFLVVDIVLLVYFWKKGKSEELAQIPPVTEPTIAQ